MLTFAENDLHIKSHISAHLPVAVTTFFKNYL